MPTLNDYDKEDSDSGGLSEGLTPAQSNAVGSATGGPQRATPQKQQDDSFVPWSSFVSANQDVSQREAGKLAGEVQGDVSKAQSDLSNDQSAFNQGIGQNYNQAKPKAQKAEQAPSPEQNQPQAGSASGSWSDFTTPSVSSTGVTAQRGQHQAPGAAINGPAQGIHSTGATAAAAQPAQSQTTASNPANVVQPTGRLTPAGTSAYRTNTAATAGATSPTLPQPQQQNAASQGLQSLARSSTLTPGAAGGNPAGAKDLEAAAGQQGWNQLLGDSLKAQQEANALGSETGVQGLLQSQAGNPIAGGQAGSAFDAALINGQGAPQFAKLAHDYGGNQLQQGITNAEQASQDRWNQLSRDIATKQEFDNAGAPAPVAAPVATPVATGLGAVTANSTPADNWDATYGKAWSEAQADGDKAAKDNGGQIAIGYGGSNMGLGNGEAINVTPAGSGKPPHGGTWAQDPQTVSNWWGGAGGPAIGDKSIDAATWYALAELPPEARAAWWKHHKAGG